MRDKLKIIRFLSFFIFLACVLYLGYYFYSSYQARNDLEQLQQVVEQAEAPAMEPGQEPEVEEEKYAENGMLLQYAKLYEQNQDLVGWIKIPETKINYPVMYHNGDAEYYLHRNFEKKYQYSGLPFLDVDCDISAPSTNLIVYGHHMKDKSMFTTLLDYEEKSYWEQNRYMQFDTLYERGKYEIYAVMKTQAGHAKEGEFQYFDLINAKSQEEFDSYIANVKKEAVYDTGIVPQYGEQLLTLSTCSYHVTDGRFVVFARKI